MCIPALGGVVGLAASGKKSVLPAISPALALVSKFGRKKDQKAAGAPTPAGMPGTVPAPGGY